MDFGDDGATFVIMSGPDEDAREVAELSIIDENMSCEDCIRLAWTLVDLSKMILVEAGQIDEAGIETGIALAHRSKLH